MKIILCLFLIQVYSCLGDNTVPSYVGDRNFGPSQHGVIERPCSIEDISCIRQALGLSSHCNHGPAPDHRRIRLATAIIPHSNITLRFNEVNIEGLNDFKLKQFYTNVETSTVVLEVQFRSLRLHAPDTEMIFHRKAMEALQLADYINIEYRDLSMTLNAPLGHYDKIAESHVYTFVTDAAPNYEMGPLYTHTREKLVRKVISSIVNNVGLTLQEGFVTVGPSIMYAFLQSNFCGHKCTVNLYYQK